MPERIKSFFRHSATIVWARLVASIGLALAVCDPVLDLLAVPGVKDQVQAILDPRYVPFYLIAIAIVTELARRRTLPRSSGKDGV